MKLLRVCESFAIGHSLIAKFVWSGLRQKCASCTATPDVSSCTHTFSLIFLCNKFAGRKYPFSSKALGDSVSEWVSQPLLILEQIERSRHLWPLTHLVRVMKTHDLTNKNTTTKTMTNTLREHLQRAIFEADTQNFYPILTSTRSLCTIIEVYCIM